MIADFGIARWINKNTGHPDGQSWFGAGTPGYRAPEQYMGGKGDPTVQSDVYSLGVIVHEMLSGHRPPIGAREILQPLREIKRTISSDVEAVVQRATKADPRDRYESITGFLNAFKQAVDNPRQEEVQSVNFPQSTKIFRPPDSGPRRRWFQ